MKKKKRSVTALVLALLLLALTACGGASGGDNGGTVESAPGMFNSAATGDAWNESGWTGTDSAADYDVPQESVDSGASRPQNTKIIYSADMELETKEFDSAVQALDHIVEGLGGWFESQTLNQGGSYRSLSCTVRVPSEHFTALLDQAGQAAHMTYRQEYQDDVSESYYDNEARLTTQRTKLERLQELLAKAESMEDIIALESAISDTELEIEYLTGSLRHYDSLVGYSTVTISLREVYRLSTDEEPAVTFGQRLAAAFSTGLRRGVDGLEDFALFLARNWAGGLMVAAIGAAAVLVFLRHRRKRRERKAPPSPPDGGVGAPPPPGK